MRQKSITFDAMENGQAFFNWSGGKDSSLALYYALKEGRYPIRYLLTNLSGEHDRISMHGVRRSLLEAQVRSIGIDLDTLSLPKDISMEDYSKLMETKLSDLKKSGMTHAFFGDIFLEDLKQYREEKLKAVGLTAVFPLWQKSTESIINEFLDLGFKAKIVSANARLLDESFCGRELDHSFISDLPEGVDVCGENGEFHSFVYDGPIFSEPIPIKVGETIKRIYKTDGKSNWDNAFWYTDLEMAGK